MKPHRAVIYCRVSTQEQAEHGTSLESQELACLRRAAEMGAQVLATYQDEGVSGGIYLSRNGIQAALTDIEAGRADRLIVYSISRLSRDVEHQQAIKKRLERAGGRLIVCDMPLEDTEEGELMFGVSGAFAQYERKLIRKRTMMGSHRQAENGRQPSRGRRPYGYVLVTEYDVLTGAYPPGTSGTYIVHEEEATIVREIFALFAGGRSLRGVSEWLNREGVPTPKNGECWRPRSVMCILQNPIYKGTATYGLRQTYHDESRKTEQGFKHDVFQRVRPEGALVYIPAPALVSEVTWETCQERLKTNRAYKSGNPSRVYLLSGVARCPVCGRGLAGRTFGSHAYYGCNNLDANGHLPRRCYRVADLEAELTDNMVRVLSHPDSLQAAYEEYRLLQMEPRHVGDVPALRRELSDLDAQETATARAQVEALMKGRSTEVYDRLLEEIGRKRAALKAVLEGLEAEEVRTKEIDPLACSLTAHEAIDALHKVLTAPQGILPVKIRREAIGGFIQKLVPGEEGMRIVWLPFRENGRPFETPGKLCTSGW